MVPLSFVSFRFVYLGLFHMWLLRPSQDTKVHTFIDKNTYKWK